MYAIFFDYNNTTYRLPTNPEEIKDSYSQSVQKYEILQFGQIAVPTNMELREFSFECELPREFYKDEKKPNDKETSEYFIKIFKEWVTNQTPILFKAGLVNSQNTSVEPDSIDLKVIIEELEITEKAGEEGDKYVSFKLLEYVDYTAIQGKLVDELTGEVKDNKKQETNPKSTGSYVVKKGDTLWSIAKKFYGSGTKYNLIVNANKDKIKNPALILPGWKLIMPNNTTSINTKKDTTKSVTKKNTNNSTSNNTKKNGREQFYTLEKY